jgi:hypothetical protein
VKNEFFGFYAPTDSDYERLIKEGLVVFDANVLLRLYQYPDMPRDEAIDVLKKLGDRAWLPHFAALEYQLNRVGVIAKGIKQIEIAKLQIREAFSQSGRLIDELELEKRGIEADTVKLKGEIDTTLAALTDVLDKAAHKQLSISTTDPVRDQINSIFAGRVGAPPAAQAEADALMADGEQRYANKIPPGYMDQGKEKKPDRKTIWFDGISYQRKFGDLIIWNQVLAYAREKKAKVVLLVTGDTKEDWWWEEYGKTLGPRHELVREARMAAGIDLFWAYNFAQFLENARKYLAADVSQETIVEVKLVSSRQPQIKTWSALYAMMQRSIATTALMQSLTMRGLTVVKQSDFPMLIASRDNGSKTGLDVVATSTVDAEMPYRYAEKFKKGLELIAAEQMGAFILVVVVPKEVAQSDDWSLIGHDIFRNMDIFPNCFMEIGYLEGLDFVRAELIRGGPFEP